MKAILTVSILICMCLWVSIAWSDIIHVPGDQPTIQAGIDAAVDGDRVLVADGTYTGDGNKDLDFGGKAITVTSENGAEKTIIDCEYDGRGFYFHSGETEESVVSGFTIKNGSASPGSGGGISLENSSPTIEGNIIKNNRAVYGGGISCKESSPTIQNNEIIGNSADKSKISLPSPTGGGIYLSNSSPTIVNNTISGNSSKSKGGGISCWSSSSVKVLNTIFWENNPDEIFVDASSINITYSDIRRGHEGKGNIDAAPMFVDLKNGDYHLQAGSPCIDAGTPEGAPDTDIEGNPRPPGVGVDMGAYEFPNPPIIVIETPNGGEKIKGRSVYNIRWNTMGDGIDHIHLLYKNGGDSYQDIDANTADDGTYEWTTPAIDSSTVGVKAIVEDASDNALAADESDADFTIDSTTPETTASLSDTKGENGWYISNVTVSLSATDTLSGVKETKYKINDGDWKIYASPFTVSVTTTVYYKSEDKVGNIEAEKAIEIKIDKTSPETPVVFDDGDFTPIGDQLHASWASSDDESGIHEYQYAIGTTSGGTDVVSWTSTDTDTEVTATDLNLTNGQTYYFGVKAQNGAGLWSDVGVSDGIIVDNTPPGQPAVVDDGEYTTSTTQLQASWTSEDLESGISEYQYAIGTTSGGTDVVSFTSTGTATEVTKTGLSLTNGQTYYFSVKAQNGSGLWSNVGVSDEITVDGTAPETIASLSGTEGENGWYTSNVTVSLSATDTLSGVKETKYKINDGDWKIYASPFTVSVTTTVYYKSEDKVGNIEAEKAIEIKIDKTAPETPVVIDDGDFTPIGDQLHASWASSDDESGIHEYQYAIGTTPGGTDVVPWTSVGASTEVTKTGLSLTVGPTYYFAVKAQNGAGLSSEVGVSDGITVLIIKTISVSPESGSVGTAITLTGNGFGKSENIGKLMVNKKETPVTAVGETVVIDRDIWTNDEGTFAVRFSIPRQPGGGTIIAVGDAETRLMIVAKITVNPKEGPVGTPVTVTGDGFGSEEDIQVDFGDTKKIVEGKTTLDGSFEATFEADAQEIGEKRIVTTGLEGTADDYFELTPPDPKPDKIFPTSGPTEGETEITLTGQGFVDGATVTIGGKEVKPELVTFVSEKEIIAITPANTAGKKDVTVTNPSGKSGTLKKAFEYYKGISPILSAIIPAIGSTEGGTEITLTGENFVSGATVRIGEENATVFDVYETVITAKTPPHTLGKKPVIVTNPDGKTSEEEISFEYIIPIRVFNIDPDDGSTKGGTNITLTGQGFLDGATVTIGGKDAKVTSVSEKEITVITQANTAGRKKVTVTNPDGNSSEENIFFEYIGGPEIFRVFPISGSKEGGTEITLTGERFSSKATVTVGGKEVTDVEIVSQSKITAKTPKDDTGVKDVVVTNPYWEPAILEGSFYVPNLTLNPSEGHIGDDIEVHGENYPKSANVGQLKLDGAPAVAVNPVGDGEVIRPNDEINTSKTGSFTVDVSIPEGEGGLILVEVDTASVYFTIKPKISISPEEGAAGTKISLEGNGFVAGEKVNINFGATENIATGDADGDGNLQIQFEADQQTPSTLDVVARGVFSDYDAKALFEFSKIHILTISPASASIEGGTEVTITGKGFVSGATVTVGGKEAKVLYVNQQGTEIAADTPVISIRELLDLSEPKDVTVTNPDGQSDTLKEVFNYYLLYLLSLARDWNLIAFPGDVIELSPDGFFGADITQIQDASEKKPDSFEFGEGYWVWAIQDTQREVKIIPKEQYTRGVVAHSWNLIGSVYGGAPIPTGVTQLYSWNAKQKQYDVATLLEPSKGYWALVPFGDTEITVKTEVPPPPAPTTPSDILPSFQLPLLVSGGHKTTTRLTIGVHPDAKSGWDSRFDVALPPLSPGGKLPRAALLLDGDVPLRLSRKILPIPKSGGAEFLLQVENPEGDAVLSWDAKKIHDDWSLSLIDQTRQIDMRQQSKYSLPKGKREIVLVLKQRSKQPLPKSDALLQNYPNPFNPETWIPYQLADSAQILLIIYDVRGRIVRKFNIGQKAAGFYVDREKAAHWDGRNNLGERVSSGIYFYRLKVGPVSVGTNSAIPSIGAGKFNAMRKMVILK